MVSKEEQLPSTRVTDADYNSTEYITSIPLTPPPADGSVRSPFERRRLISPWSWVMLILFVLRIIVYIAASPSTLYAFLYAFLALLPAVLSAHYILRAFRDGSVPDSFLLSQFLVGAIPLVILAIIVELVFSLLSFLPVMAMIPKETWERIKELLNVTNEKQAIELLQQLAKDFATKVPTWSIILSLALMAYVSAGSVEETGKWLFARRYRKFARAGAEARPIGSSAIFASACMVALGFATMENIGYVMNMGKYEVSSFPYLLVFLALFRGLLAFPVHVGTQMYVAIAAAQRYVFGDQTSVIWALFLAILFHGTFDAVAFTTATLVALQKVPEWVSFAVPIFDLFFVSLLVLLVRSRYKGLQERERVAGVEPV